MFPYRFETAPAASAAVPAAPAAQREPTPASRDGRRPLGAAGLVALALFSGAIGGGAATVGARLVQPVPIVASGSAAGQPVAGAAAQAPATTAAPAAPLNVAGAVFAKINPAVVQIVVSGATRSPTGSGSGSGVVVEQSGRVLTNNHVVQGARAISVRFVDGTVREARVLGTDRGNDLALLQVELPPGAAVAPLGDSDKVAVGETAIAIGSPFGLESTVTQGIVSAVQRTWAPGSGRVRRGLIQTDAPINPGNSGGPLLNAAGEVIGINTMIESPVRGSVGVGFAVPINTAKQIMAQLAAGARLEPVWLGVSGQDLDATIARDQAIPVQSGVLLVAVVPDSPAARAGLRGGSQAVSGTGGGAGERIPRGGDVITAIDGQPLGNMRQLTEALVGKKPGDTVQLTIVRGGATQTVAVQLRTWPAEQE
jgi:S1-C subfamily serine protease